MLGLSHLHDGLQQVQHDEVSLGGQVPADDSLLVQLGLGPDDIGTQRERAGEAVWTRNRGEKGKDKKQTMRQIRLEEMQRGTF